MCELEATENTCASPIPLVCDDFLVSDTMGALNLITEYPSCMGRPEPDAEHVYRFVPTADEEVTVFVQSLSGRHDLFVLEGECLGTACLTFGADHEVNMATFDATAGTPYFIVVDGAFGQEGSYQLKLDCGGPCVPDCAGLECGPDPVCGESCGTCGSGLWCNAGSCDLISTANTCLDPGTLTCGSLLMDDTTGAPNLIEHYNCNSIWDIGGEHVYRFLRTADVVVTVEVSGMTADLDLFVLEEQCIGAACIRQSAGDGTETVTFLATAGTPYYIVVDGYLGAADVYTLSLTCADP